MVEVEVSDDWILGINVPEFEQWVASIGIAGDWSYSRGPTGRKLYMTFINEEDAVAFKLRYNIA